MPTRWPNGSQAATPSRRSRGAITLSFTGLPPRLTQMIANHDQALARLMDRLREAPLTACDAFPVIFGRDIGAAEYGLALVEAVAHMNHLGRLGQARRTRRGDGAWLWHPA
jgi:hypothetical protein